MNDPLGNHHFDPTCKFDNHHTTKPNFNCYPLLRKKKNQCFFHVPGEKKNLLGVALGTSWQIKQQTLMLQHCIVGTGLISQVSPYETLKM